MATVLTMLQEHYREASDENALDYFTGGYGEATRAQLVAEAVRCTLQELLEPVRRWLCRHLGHRWEVTDTYVEDGGEVVECSRCGVVVTHWFS
jgi:hypothetical protein